MGYGLFSRTNDLVSKLIEPTISEQNDFGVRSSLVAGILSYPMIAAFNAIGPQTLAQAFTNKYTLISAALIIPAKMFYNYYFGQEAHPRIGPRLVDALRTGMLLGIPLISSNYYNSDTGLEYVLKTGGELGVIGAAKFVSDSVGNWLGDRAGWS